MSPGESGPNEMINIKELLKKAHEHQASDLHIKAGVYPTLRVRGELVPLNSHPRVTKQDTLDLAHHLLNTRQKEDLAQKVELDIGFGGSGNGRFRLALFHQRGSVSLVFRLIPERVPSLDELNLPPVLRDIADEHHGLVLITGATGSGKSTTMASMLQHVNTTRRTHIVSIEDPIEFSLNDELSLITQREIGMDTKDFASALRSVLRQDPDIIMVGEIRDPETVLAAIQAAETGHLVMSTLHTADTAETVNRVLSMFPSSRQSDVRFRFAAALRAIISIRLLKSSITGRRIPAVEVLRNTGLIASLIEQPGRTKEIRRALEAGHSQYGTQSLDHSIFSHWRNNLISDSDALENATTPEDLRLRMEGIVSSAESV